MKLNTDDEVVIQSTGSMALDGIRGTVLGPSSNGLVTLWIVGLSRSIHVDGQLYRAVTVPGSCLRKIPNTEVV